MNTDSAYQVAVAEADPAGSPSIGSVIGGFVLAIVLVVGTAWILEKIMGRDR